MGTNNPPQPPQPPRGTPPRRPRGQQNANNRAGNRGARRRPQQQQQQSTQNSLIKTAIELGVVGFVFEEGKRAIGWVTKKYVAAALAGVMAFPGFIAGFGTATFGPGHRRADPVSSNALYAERTVGSALDSFNANTLAKSDTWLVRGPLRWFVVNPLVNPIEKAWALAGGATEGAIVWAGNGFSSTPSTHTAATPSSPDNPVRPPDSGSASKVKSSTPAAPKLNPDSSF